MRRKKEGKEERKRKVIKERFKTNHGLAMQTCKGEKVARWRVGAWVLLYRQGQQS
jgi:hypothetical protein